MGQSTWDTRFFFSSETENRVTAKMRLYLAVAVLMLAFVAYTEAQEETIEQKSEVGKSLADRAKTTFDQIQTSEFASTTKSWFEEQVEKLNQASGNLPVDRKTRFLSTTYSH